MSGWTVVDPRTNKSLPVSGTANQGTQGIPFVDHSPSAKDPVNRIRVSQPQALIDTDFEYGPQPTKWESISLQNNRASMYYIPQQPLAITAVTGAGTTTVSVTGTGFNLTVGQPIYIQNCLDPNANGWWYVASTTSTTGFTYTTTNAVASGNQYNPAISYLYAGYFYTSSGVNLGANAFTNTGTTVTCTTTYPHDFVAGSLIYVVGTTASTNAPNGAWAVATVPSNNTFTFVVPSAPTGTIVNSAGNAVLYARSSGYVEQRAFDGGVAFSAGAGAPGSQTIRQTRRYFRYQSGKAIQFSTGTTFNPPLLVTGISASGTTVTVTTRFAHNLVAGGYSKVVIANANDPNYNGTWAVTSTPTPNSFTVTTNYAPTVSPDTSVTLQVSPTSWYGSVNRVGFFDSQNGIFFEYDGQNLYTVSRNSTTTIDGLAQVTQGSATVTGTGTLFSSQLKPSDFIVIRGQTYRVTTISSDTSMTISPEYRGVTISQGGCIITKTIDTRVPRSQWQDPLDGTGPSGYTLDLTRMQMLYLDYSWYGAGYIRWGMRTTNGQISYVNQKINNNQQYLAWMRSGNMVARYETSTILPYAYITATVPSSAVAGAIISVNDCSRFAPTGTIKLTAPGAGGAVEYISYTKVPVTPATNPTTYSTTKLQIVARAQTGGAATAQQFTYSATAPIAAEFGPPDCSATLSHWGSSIIMDGNFDNDKSLLFNYGMTTPVGTSSTTPVLLMAIRIAPSVDAGTTGLLGARELTNRLKLELNDLGIVATGNTYLVNLIINGYASGAASGTFQTPIQQTNGISSSFSQVAVNTNAVNVVGGESAVGAYCAANNVTVVDLSEVRDLGNSILGGGYNNNVPTTQAGFYPDGPDIVYVVAQAISATAGTILARISWKEAQA